MGSTVLAFALLAAADVDPPPPPLDEVPAEAPPAADDGDDGDDGTAPSAAQPATPATPAAASTTTPAPIPAADPRNVALVIAGGGVGALAGLALPGLSVGFGVSQIADAQNADSCGQAFGQVIIGAVFIALGLVTFGPCEAAGTFGGALVGGAARGRSLIAVVGAMLPGLLLGFLSPTLLFVASAMNLPLDNGVGSVLLGVSVVGGLLSGPAIIAGALLVPPTEEDAAEPQRAMAY